VHGVDSCYKSPCQGHVICLLCLQVRDNFTTQQPAYKQPIGMHRDICTCMFSVIYICKIQMVIMQASPQAAEQMEICGQDLQMQAAIMPTMICHKWPSLCLSQVQALWPGLPLCTVMHCMHTYLRPGQESSCACSQHSAFHLLQPIPCGRTESCQRMSIDCHYCYTRAQQKPRNKHCTYLQQPGQCTS